MRCEILLALLRWMYVEGLLRMECIRLKKCIYANRPILMAPCIVQTGIIASGPLGMQQKKVSSTSIPRAHYCNSFGKVVLSHFILSALKISAIYCILDNMGLLGN